MWMQVLRSVPPGFGAEQILFLLGVFNGEPTGAHYDPVTVSLHQSLVGDADRGSSPPIPSAEKEQADYNHKWC